MYSNAAFDRSASADTVAVSSGHCCRFFRNRSSRRKVARVREFEICSRVESAPLRFLQGLQTPRRVLRSSSLIRLSSFKAKFFPYFATSSALRACSPLRGSSAGTTPFAKSSCVMLRATILPFAFFNRHGGCCAETRSFGEVCSKRCTFYFASSSAIRIGSPMYVWL